MTVPIRMPDNKRLLLHPRLCGKCGGYIVQVPHLVPLVGGIGGYSFSPACSSSASFSCGGSPLSRSAARRRMPRQAFLLK